MQPCYSKSYLGAILTSVCRVAHSHNELYRHMFVVMVGLVYRQHIGTFHTAWA